MSRVWLAAVWVGGFLLVAEGDLVGGFGAVLLQLYGIACVAFATCELTYDLIYGRDENDPT